MTRIQDIPNSKIPQWLIDNADFDATSLEDLCLEIDKFLEEKGDDLIVEKE